MDIKQVTKQEFETLYPEAGVTYNRFLIDVRTGTRASQATEALLMAHTFYALGLNGVIVFEHPHKALEGDVLVYTPDGKAHAKGAGTGRSFRYKTILAHVKRFQGL
jgi:hypothetical protein